MNGSESLKIVLLTRVSFALQSDSKIPMSRELPFIRRGIIILEIFVFIFVTSFHLSRIIFEICSVIEKYRWSSSVLRTSFQVISKRISRKKFRVLRGRREIATNSVTSETRAGGKGRGSGRIACRTRISRDTRENGGSPRQGFGELTSF